LDQRLQARANKHDREGNIGSEALLFETSALINEHDKMGTTLAENVPIAKWEQVYSSYGELNSSMNYHRPAVFERGLDIGLFVYGFFLPIQLRAKLPINDTHPFGVGDASLWWVTFVVTTFLLSLHATAAFMSNPFHDSLLHAESEMSKQAAHTRDTIRKYRESAVTKAPNPMSASPMTASPKNAQSLFKFI
jgi:hypothetical protein